MGVVGIPDSAPVAALKIAHDGLPEIANVSLYPLGPLALGVKLYGCQERTVVLGVPEMVGGAGVAARAALLDMSATIAQPQIAS